MKRSAGELLFSIQVDRSGGTAISTQLYSAMRRMILSGDLPAGRRLPSSRTLADELAVSRTTALSAFERLAAEGLIVSRTGSGSYVAHSAMQSRPAAVLEVTAAEVAPSSTKLADLITDASPRLLQRLEHPQKPRAFVTGLPDYDAFPLPVWARLTAEHWRRPRDQVMSYSDANGHPRLRQAIAEHLRSNRGIPCDAEQIFIVNGAQQAFDLIGRMLLNPGDPVWFENPGAIGARNSLVACGARIVPVPIDAEGMSVSAAKVLEPRFRLAFVTPSHQHPTGIEMSLARRGELLAAAAEQDAWIIEDDYDGEFRYDGRPLPTLKSADASERVFYVGTFSKTLFPALRLGFYLAPRPLVSTFRDLSGAFLQGVPSSIQAVLAAFIEEGHFATHLRRMRGIYAARHEAFHAAARKHLAGRLLFRPSVAGFHVSGSFVETRTDENRFAREADAANLTVSPIGRFCIEGARPEPGVVLGVSAVNERAIASGVEALAGLFDRLQP
ncbi:MAG: PLP-dependent aminotransferase family protein [Mesorhizobium amorphae]|nr:MAG: PLP-dependent aminotransferase family protein [Mesorhizobium amorphae]